jgi:hypothetical protein
MIAKWLRTIISCANQFWQSEAKLCSSFNAPYCAVLSMRHKAWGRLETATPPCATFHSTLNLRALPSG